MSIDVIVFMIQCWPITDLVRMQAPGITTVPKLISITIIGFSLELVFSETLYTIEWPLKLQSAFVPTAKRIFGLFFAYLNSDRN